jgi:hypothetical protein
MDGLPLRVQGRRGRQGLARSGVAGVAGVGAAGDLQPDAVACREAVRGRPQVDGAAPRVLGRLGQAEDAVVDVDRLSFLVDVAQADEEVGVRAGGAGFSADLRFAAGPGLILVSVGDLYKS